MASLECRGRECVSVYIDVIKCFSDVVFNDVVDGASSPCSFRHASSIATIPTVIPKTSGRAVTIKKTTLYIALSVNDKQKMKTREHQLRGFDAFSFCRTRDDELIIMKPPKNRSPLSSPLTLRVVLSPTVPFCHDMKNRVQSSNVRKIQEYRQACHGNVS